jgi:hypothetical protein
MNRPLHSMRIQDHNPLLPLPFCVGENMVVADWFRFALDFSHFRASGGLRTMPLISGILTGKMDKPCHCSSPLPAVDCGASGKATRPFLPGIRTPWKEADLRKFFFIFWCV